MTYQRGDYRDKWRIESLAAQIRRGVGLNQLQVLDPQSLLTKLDADLFHLRDLLPDDEVTLQRARWMGVDGCASIHPELGVPMILLNCGRPARRRMATLMEELAHLLLDHEPTRLVAHPVLPMIITRTYDRGQEHEAYDLGAALLLPKERIQRDVKELELTTAQIAQEHGCSEDLVAYRIRRMRLWKRYLSYAAAA